MCARVAAILALTAASLVCVAPARAASPLPSLTVPQLPAAPALNGVIDASWAKAAKVQLGWDFQYRRPAEEPTTVYVAQYGQAIYVAFDATQREPITATAHTNGAGVYSDDNVAVVLSPQGTQGFQYEFLATPLGTRYQTSGENTAYAPEWTAVGHKTPAGYVVTMRIPLSVIRSASSTSWRAQFIRLIAVNGAVDEWSHDSDQRGTSDVLYAGTLNGISLHGAAKRPPPRFQPYALDELASRSLGGSTSRVGLDFSIPVTATSSFLGTIHPDYSNVETDQQSISPQEFPRQYQEVRPFFTQVGSLFNQHLGCINCPSTLYTPNIPTFSEGYAFEGTAGPMTFAGFDAIGSNRSDAAQTVGWSATSREHAAALTLQRVSVDTPSIHDDTTTFATGYGFSHNHAFVFVNGGRESGTFVPDSSQGGYAEYGAALTNQTATAVLDYTRVGSQFNPLDGYTQHPGINGIVAAVTKTIAYKPTSFVQSISFQGNFDRFRDRLGNPNQSDDNLFVNVQLRNLLQVGGNTGSSYLLTPDGEFAPFNQNSVLVTYRGGTATSSQLSYSFGRYYHGFLSSWYRSTTLPVAKRLLLSLEDDGTAYTPDPTYGPASSRHEIAASEQLQRASLDWQFNTKASLDVGVRRIHGIFAPTGYGYVPTTATALLDAVNLTAAFHFLALRNEFYVVYGDPSQLSTSHALFLKWIRYIGAPKGT